MTDINGKDNESLVIPDKLFFKIGEVAKITGLKTYVLRYWESEFPTIKPTKSKTNQRVYQRKDILTVLLIKKLLYEEKFTIEGARSRLKELRKQKIAKASKKQTNTGQFDNIRIRLNQIASKLSKVYDLLEQER